MWLQMCKLIRKLNRLIFFNRKFTFRLHFCDRKFFDGNFETANFPIKFWQEFKFAVARIQSENLRLHNSHPIEFAVAKTQSESKFAVGENQAVKFAN